MTYRRTLAGIVTGLLLFTFAAHAGSLPAPQGDVVLTIEGTIGNTNADGKALFDMAMLESMPRKIIVTKTIWTDGEQRFEGVMLADLLEKTAAKGTRLRAVALNDYAVILPVSDAAPGRAMIAYRQNGKEMSRRTKGPLWIVYPFDSDPEFRTETIYARSIWQLVRLEILD